MAPIYLDNAATTEIHPDVLEEMRPYLKDQYFNPSTLYSGGREAARAVQKAREQVAKFINADPMQIIFTSGGTEANNTVLRSPISFKSRKKILISASEHDSIMNTYGVLRRIGEASPVEPIRITSDGVIDMDDFKEKLTDDTDLVSVMYVNNETGAINPVLDIGKMCMEHGAFFHTDCVQAAGNEKIDVNEIQCDFISLSSHKIHGPKGVGALYVKDKSELSPLIIGGNGHEMGMRGGTENVAGIVGFGKACELAGKDSVLYAELKKEFLDSLYYSLSQKGFFDIVTINGNPEKSTAKIINLRIKGVDGETLVLMLSATGIYISAGAACRSHETTPSYVLTAMGLSPEEAMNSVRIAFSRFNSETEVIVAARHIADCVEKLLKN